MHWPPAHRCHHHHHQEQHQQHHHRQQGTLFTSCRVASCRVRSRHATSRRVTESRQGVPRRAPLLPPTSTSTVTATYTATTLPRCHVIPHRAMSWFMTFAKEEGRVRTRSGVPPILANKKLAHSYFKTCLLEVGKADVARFSCGGPLGLRDVSGDHRGLQVL